MKCKHCGYEIDETMEYCPHCGRKAERESAKVCSFCGAPVVDGASFCTNCGKPVGQQTTSSPYEPANKTPIETVFGILSIVFAFLSPIVGLVLGAIAIDKSKQAGNSSAKTLGTIGLIVSVVFIVLSVVSVIVFFGLLNGAFETYWPELNEMLQEILSRIFETEIPGQLT